MPVHDNRHGDFRKQIDHTNTWNRPWSGYKAPQISADLSFISVALDMAYAAYSLGYQKREEAPRMWAERLLNLIIKQRDPETGIWPNLVHPQSGKRGLNVFGRKYPQATEPRVYVGNQLNHTITQMMGMLTIVENAQKYGRIGEMAHVKAAVEQHIIGFLNAAYDRKNNTLKSIVIDGTDLTGFRIRGPLQDGETLFWRERRAARFCRKTSHRSLPPSVPVDIGFLGEKASSETTYARCLKPLGLETSVPIKTLHRR